MLQRLRFRSPRDVHAGGDGPESAGIATHRAARLAATTEARGSEGQPLPSKVLEFLRSPRRGRSLPSSACVVARVLAGVLVGVVARVMTRVGNHSNRVASVRR